MRNQYASVDQLIQEIKTASVRYELAHAVWKISDEKATANSLKMWQEFNHLHALQDDLLAALNAVALESTCVKVD